jgi:hypothetical protein
MHNSCSDDPGRLPCGEIPVRGVSETSEGDKRIVLLVDAPTLPDGEAVMRVEGGGLKPE